ncbi:uncharacterized protein LOC142981283 [Anticarsia gemmatalis]|uniref:uncharacterized protein LOC142981283 n=1 Tax=Anticarsia gemmatalis TaxID=129554 RepID=UPI003F764AC7
METRSKNKRIGPLSGGDRRSTPGVDAGCSSMRSVGGVELNRRAPSGLDPNATANHTQDRQTDDDNISLSSYTSIVEPFSPSTTSYNPTPVSSMDEDSRGAPTPTLSVAQVANAFLPASTKAGKPRVRMSWSKDVNMFIMRTYFYITKLETDMTIYRKTLHEQFSLKYPDVKVTEQRVSDQRRTIVRNKLLSQEILNSLKEEVRIQLENETHTSPIHTSPESPSSSHSQDRTLSLSHTQTQSQIHTQTSSHTHTSHTSTQTESVTLTLENDIETLEYSSSEVEIHIQDITDKFRVALTKYSGLNPASRPKLPRLKYSPKLPKLVNLFNQNILHRFLNDHMQLTDVHTVVYCTAVVITEELQYKIVESVGNTRRKDIAKPPWQIRLEKDIEKLRADCGRLTQYINNNRSQKVVKRVEEIFRSRILHTRHENDNRKPEEFLDTLKQKLALKVHRLRRYKKAQQRKNDNILFNSNEKIFYRNLQKPHTNTQATTTDTPTKTQLEEFWSNIWEKEVEHNHQAEWILEEENRWSEIGEMEFDEITQSDIKNITDRLHNWKAPGIDKIHNYWFKKLTSLHKHLATNFTDIVLGKQNIPEFLSTGITYMLPKSNHTSEPSQYRPITCLPTLYKILTSTITRKINNHIENNCIIAEEQKGCRRGHMGCKEQLVIDSTIHKHATTKNRNLHCTYIDYKKAFDSIPHSWLIQILKIYKINPKVTDFLKNIMTQWKTSLHLTSQNITITTRQISIKKGIYQGDSLSPLWFCLALNPLSHMLHRFHRPADPTANQSGYITDPADITCISDPADIADLLTQQPATNLLKPSA